MFDIFSLVILEAMACGLPVAAYNVPSTSDIIQNSITGFLEDSLEENIEKSCRNYMNFQTMPDTIQNLKAGNP